jgi:NAD-dependent dihydropyrimidine dehydrogenase PreA subunit/flavodoxin
MIFYFSGTGNTRWAARQLADATGEQLICIPEHTADKPLVEPQPNERIGFCFPVHGWRPPIIVREFIRNIQLRTEGHYVYALCTAGDTIGETIDIFEHDLRNKGIKLDAAFSLIMPETYVGLPFMDVDSPENEQRKISQAAVELKKYTSIILNRQSQRILPHIGKWPKINSRLIGDVFVKHLITDKHFHVNSEKCVKCGICADVCPVKDIEGGLGFEPKWKHNDTCLTCFACYHHCPHHAIEFGNRTKNKGQYFFNHHRSKSSE